jgi:DNA-binding LacI/PurR family transcriptional regulator
VSVKFRVARPVNIQDVAAAAKVSIAAVSYAFSRPDQVSAEVRKRILKIARELGYNGPNPVARSLRKRRANAIGVLFDERLTYAFADSAAALFLQGVAEATEEEKTGLLLVSCPKEQGNQVINEAAVDGFVVYGVARDDARVRAVLARRLPIVLVDHRSIRGVSNVTIADRHGAYLAARHLLELDHQHIAVVSFRLNRTPFDGFVSPDVQEKPTLCPSAERLAGYRKAVAEFGLDWSSSVRVYQCVHSSVEAGRKSAAALIKSKFCFSAALAMSDVLAIGLIEQLVNLGLRVPANVSVVGFDDIPESVLVRPPLTTVHQEHKAKGLLAGRKLIDLILDRAVRDQPVIPEPQLIVRQSTILRPKRLQRP